MQNINPGVHEQYDLTNLLQSMHFHFPYVVLQLTSRPCKKIVDGDHDEAVLDCTSFWMLGGGGGGGVFIPLLKCLLLISFLAMRCLQRIQIWSFYKAICCILHAPENRTHDLANASSSMFLPWKEDASSVNCDGQYSPCICNGCRPLQGT